MSKKDNLENQVKNEPEVVSEGTEKDAISEKHEQIARAMDLVEQLTEKSRKEKKEDKRVLKENKKADKKAEKEKRKAEKRSKKGEINDENTSEIDEKDSSKRTSKKTEDEIDEKPASSITAQRGGKINRKKSAYSYLFDESQDMPENVSEENVRMKTKQNDEEDASSYSYLYIKDDTAQFEIPKQENTAENEAKSRITAEKFESQEPEKTKTTENKASHTKVNEKVDEMFATQAILEMEEQEEIEAKLQAKIQAKEDSEIRKKMKGFADGVADRGAEAAQKIKEQIVQEDEHQEFTRAAQAEQIKEELYGKLSDHILRMTVSGIAFAILLICEIIGFFGGMSAFSPANPILYYGINLLVTIVVAMTSHKTIVQGIKGIYTRQLNGNLSYSVAFLAVIIQNISLMFSSGTAQLRSYSVIIILALFASELGQFINIVRVGRNFTFVSNKAKRGAVLLAADDEGGKELGSLVRPRNPIMGYQAKTNFLSEFLTFAYEEDPSEKVCSKIAPVMSGASALVGIIAGIVSGSVLAGISAFAATAVVSIPMTKTLSVNLPLLKVSKDSLKSGAMISGWAAVDEFCDVNAIAIDEDMLFPAANIELVGIKVFGDKRVDDVILNAAAVAISFGGSLSKVFGSIIGERTEMLPAIQGVEYEQGQGLCGWVGGQRILIGNLEFLSKYGISPPRKNYEDVYSQQDASLLYLASDGDLSAMFVLKYHTDEKTVKAIQKLEQTGVKFVVKTVNINVTAEMIAKKYSISEKSVAVIPHELSGKYDALTKEVRKKTPAVLATNRTLLSVASGIYMAISAKSTLAVAVILQTAGIILGFVLACVLSLTGIATTITPMQMLLYFLFWFVAVLVVPRLKKPNK